jgi:hypothetical protein
MGFYDDLISSSYIGGYFESWMQILGPHFFPSLNFERISRFKIGYAHWACHPNLGIKLCKASMAHPFQ